MTTSKRRYVITDAGRKHVVSDRETGRYRLTIPRYGVWTRDGGRARCVEAGNDLADLQRRYGVEGDPIQLPGYPSGAQRRKRTR